MLGLRGVRLGLVVPGLFAIQARALLLAAADRLAAGADPQVEIMVPLVASVHELELVRAELRAGARRRRGRGRTWTVPCRIGTMIEVPRAALTAGPDRQPRGLLLLRHQRPHPDDLGILPRRRRGVVLLRVPRPRRSSRSRRSSRWTSKASAPWCGPRPRTAAPSTRRSTSGSAASTAETRGRSTSSTRSGWTTCHAHRSGSRSPGSRPAGRPSPRSDARPSGRRAQHRATTAPCRDCPRRRTLAVRNRSLEDT